MSDVTIYTAMLCGYCSRAKSLLDKKGIDYTEIDISLSPDLRAEMTQKSGGARTVPQIFIGEQHIGGCDDLWALDQDGKLDPILGL